MERRGGRRGGGRALPKLERQQQRDASWGKSRLRQVETRSGKLTRPLTNRLTPSLIDFLQRDPFANGVSAPTMASEPVDVTLPDLIAAPRFQQCTPPSLATR